MGHVLTALAWLLGLMAQQTQAQLWPLEAYGALAGLAAGLAIARRHTPAPLLCALIAAAMLAWAWSGARASLKPALGARVQGQETWAVRGVIVDWVRPLPQGARFQLQVQERRDAQAGWQANDALLQLSWYRMPADVQLAAGDRWQMGVRVRAPHGHRNPYGRDTEQRAWRDELAAVGQVWSPGGPPQLLARSQGGWLLGWRDQVRRRLLATALAPRAQAWLAALVLGDRSMLSVADWEVLQATGTAHLLSVSGLHITVWAGLAWWLSAWAWRALAVWPLRRVNVPRAHLASGMALLLALAYALLAGGAIPVQRAWLMLFTVWALRHAVVVWPVQLVLAVVAVVVTLWDPWAVGQTGFWLSFVAVWALLTGMDPAAKHWRARWLNLWRAQWRIGWVLMPISAWWLGQWSGLGFVVNLLAIPWVTVLVLPAALAGLWWPGFWSVAAALLSPMMQGLDGVSAWGGGVWRVSAPPAAWAVLAALGLWWTLRPGAWGWRLPALAWVLPALMWRAPPPPPGVFELWAWDVGQGSAVLVRTAQHNLLVDTGPSYWMGGDAATRLIVPSLQRAGMDLHALVLSHEDHDHVGGRASLVREFPDLQLWSSFAWPGHPTLPCLAGRQWTWDGVQFAFVHPKRLPQGRANNADACVLRIQTASASALLPADIGVAEEAGLLAAGGVRPVDLLVAAHHGSRSSSSEPWLRALSPQWVWVQAGWGNRYGHPSPEVVERFTRLGLRWQQTADCGALRWRSDRPQVSSCERFSDPRYWSPAPK